MGKKIASVIILLALCIPALAVDIPNMVGNWTATAHGVDWYRFSTTQPIDTPIHWNRTYTLAINEQNGTEFSGNFVNNAYPQNSPVVLGVIGPDNKTIALADETGGYWGTMNSPTEMIIYSSFATLERLNVGVGTLQKSDCNYSTFFPRNRHLF